MRFAVPITIRKNTFNGGIPLGTGILRRLRPGSGPANLLFNEDHRFFIIAYPNFIQVKFDGFEHFLQQTVMTMIRKATINYLMALLCIVTASCKLPVKKEEKKAVQQTSETLMVPTDTLKGPMDSLKGLMDTLTGHMDTVDGKDIWICDDPTYETDVFAHSRKEYASVYKMDADRNSLGMGLINRKGVIVVPLIYDGLTVGLEGGYCKVTKNNKWGMVNAEGREIVTPQYQYIDEPIEGLFRVGNDEKYGIINIKGEIVIPVMYAEVTPAKEGMVAFMVEPQRWGYLNLKNEIVIKPEFTFSAAFENGKVILQKPDGEDYIVYKDGRVKKK